MIEIVRPSPNFKERPGSGVIDCIVLHTTEGALSGALSWLTSSQSGVSCHVLIDKEGNAYRLVDDRNEAYHAGVSELWGRKWVNGFSLGVELERETGVLGAYPYMQLMATARWCAEKCSQYQIPLNRIVPHAGIAMPLGRRSDPPNFPWMDFLLEVASKIGV